MKNIFKVVLGSGAFVVSAFSAGAAITTIIPVASSTLLADLVGYVPILFTDLLPIIAIVVGAIFAFWIINKVMSLVSKRAKS